jgi:hypothetical protein
MATANSNQLAAQLRDFAEYRRNQLDYDRRELEAKSGGLGGGALVQHDRRAELSCALLKELARFAQYIDDGSPAWIPPLSRDDLNQWRWAKEHGAEVPAHVEAQLKADGR